MVSQAGFCPTAARDERIEGVVITFVDITSRVESEAALRQSEERFRALVDASAQMVWTTDAEGRVVEDSPTGRAFTGQTYEQWKDWGWLNVIHPDDLAIAEKGWRKAVETGRPLQNEFRIYHAAHAGVPLDDRESRSPQSQGRLDPGLGRHEH